jgi:hypothetical protein
MTDELGIDPDATPIDTTASEEMLDEVEPAPLSIEDMVASYNTSMDTTTDEASTAGVFVTDSAIAIDEVDATESTLEALASRRMNADAAARGDADEASGTLAEDADASAEMTAGSDVDASAEMAAGDVDSSDAAMGEVDSSAAIATADVDSNDAAMGNVDSNAEMAADVDSNDAAVGNVDSNAEMAADVDSNDTAMGNADSNAEMAADVDSNDAAMGNVDSNAGDAANVDRAEGEANADLSAQADVAFAALHAHANELDTDVEASTVDPTGTVDAPADLESAAITGDAAADEAFASLADGDDIAGAESDRSSTDVATVEVASAEVASAEVANADMDAAYAALDADPVAADEPDSTKD